MFQIISATVSVYRSRGKQFERYGYTAFALTVFPYAVTSFANLLANMLSMDYPLFHLVSTKETQEAVGRSASVTVVVGELAPDYAFEEKMVSVLFEKTDGVFLIYKKDGAVETFLGELDISADPSGTEDLEIRSVVTVPYHQGRRGETRTVFRQLSPRTPRFDACNPYWNCFVQYTINHNLAPYTIQAWRKHDRRTRDCLALAFLAAIQSLILVGLERRFSCGACITSTSALLAHSRDRSWLHTEGRGCCRIFVSFGNSNGLVSASRLNPCRHHL